MKRLILAAAVLLATAASAQAGIVATVLPTPTPGDVGFLLEDFGTAAGQDINSDRQVTSLGSPYFASSMKVEFSEKSGIYTGDKDNVTRSPFRADAAGNVATDNNYLNARANSGSVVLTFYQAQTFFNILWGSVDNSLVGYNLLTFKFSGGGADYVVDGNTVLANLSNPPAVPGKSDLAVQFTDLAPFTTVTVTATQEAFEFVPGVGKVPDGGTTLALLGGVLMGLGALRRKFNV